MSIKQNILFAFISLMLLSFGQNAMATPLPSIGNKAIFKQGSELLQQVHSFHCKRSAGHRHLTDCPGHPRCVRSCIRYDRYNCRNVYRTCKRNAKTAVQAAICSQRFKSCKAKTRHLCKRVCSRR